MNDHVFPYKWNIQDGYPAAGVSPHNKKVFTTFSCGGGSSMGYKLAGYDVFAANDIDPQMQRVYEANHHPKYYYLAPIKDLINKTDWPDEFKDLDVLDGSPPCSTFSMAGLRDKAWGKEKHFREGQAKQVLDDLFFDFIELARVLRPKIIIAENVKGMTQGNAKGYLIEIFKYLDQAGYNTQLFLLNAASMGVPQRRERIFFLSYRKDLQLSKILLNFNESQINYREVATDGIYERPLTKYMKEVWDHRKIGDLAFSSIMARFANRPNSYFGYQILYKNKVMNTIVANNNNIPYHEGRYMNKSEVLYGTTFPEDYKFEGLNISYLCGMSVPPVMTAQVANQVYLQWLSKI